MTLYPQPTRGRSGTQLHGEVRASPVLDRHYNPGFVSDNRNHHTHLLVGATTAGGRLALFKRWRIHATETVYFPFAADVCVHTRAKQIRLARPRSAFNGCSDDKKQRHVKATETS